MKTNSTKRILSLVTALLLTAAMTACGTQPASSASSSSSQAQTSASVQEEASSSQTAASEAASSEASSSQAEESQSETGEKLTIQVAALKGPTALGMMDLMEKGEAGETANNYEFTLAGAPDELTGKIIQGELDIAAVPTNLAAVLYNKTQGQVQLAALNTLGVLYVVENGDTIHSVADLKGKTIYATGKGSTPEYALNYFLAQNGLPPGVDVTVEYKSEHAELATLLAAGEADIALLPQPFVTSVLTQNDQIRVALDLTEEWNKVSGGSVLTMGGVIVQKAFAQEHPEALQAFLEEYKASVDFVNDSANLEQAGALAEKYGIIAKAAMAQKAIPECNIVFIAGEEMKSQVAGFFQVLFEADPQSVGGQVPDEGIYYLG